MQNALKDGVYSDLPANEYHADSAIGSSTLKTLANRTPLHFIGSERKESAAYDFGTALHLAVLESSKEDKIVCGPDDRRGNKWKDLKIECDAKDKILLTSGDYEKVMKAKASIFRNDDCASLLCGKIEAELSIFHTDKETGLRCKIRPDLFNYGANVMIDLKTCLSASPEAFGRSIADYGYHIQKSFYEHVWNEHHQSEIVQFYFLCVEKEPPFATAIYQLNKATMQEGYNLMRRSMSKYIECKEKNLWPGYASGIQEIGIPGYAFKTLDLAEIPA